jgi:16S rRNA (cytosine1402-N4)-methyltransferase
VSHVPVLLDETLAALEVKPGGLYLDGTFGAGGYTRSMLERGARVIALDRDPTAIAGGAVLAAQYPDRLRLVEARFGELDQYGDRLDGVALDIGISSMQIDEAGRGFSLRIDAALDMRMESRGATAADILAGASEAELADIFFHYGEERAARRIARAIVADRTAEPFVSTSQLAGLVARVAPAPPGEHTHPATRVFQALRIAVNDELGQLRSARSAAERALKPGGRLAVVTFHSLEDRIVKQFLARRSGRGRVASRLLPGEPKPPSPSFRSFPGQPVVPSARETTANPRAKSAKLRFAERLDAPAFARDAASFIPEGR